MNKLVCSVENFLWFYSVNFKIHIIYDFRVSILKSYISWMVGPIFNLFFLKCSFGRPFVRLDDRLFVWTIVRTNERSFERTNDRPNEQTIVQTNKRTSKRTFIYIYICILNTYLLVYWWHPLKLHHIKIITIELSTPSKLYKYS